MSGADPGIFNIERNLFQEEKQSLSDTEKKKTSMWQANAFCRTSLVNADLNPCSPEGFSQTYFPKGGLLQPPLWIINTEGHITLNLLPVYRYGHPLSIDTKISTNH